MENYIHHIASSILHVLKIVGHREMVRELYMWKVERSHLVY